MAVFNEPEKWQTSLVNSGDANNIPQSTPAGSGEASFEDGFPQITQIPIGAGGIAPDRKDFNGLFKVLGDWIFFAQNGGLPTYSAAFDYVVGRYVVYNNTLYKCIQANGASSTVVAPDSVSPLGSDYWIQVATLADLDNFANTDLSNLSATGQALFTNKADKDFSNIDNTAKIAIAHNAMPSTVYDDLTTSIAIGTQFTAPADGFLYIEASASTSTAYLDAFIGATYTIRATAPGGVGVLELFAPVKKGMTYVINHVQLSTFVKHRFIYAVGSESEQ